MRIKLLAFSVLLLIIFISLGGYYFFVFKKKGGIESNEPVDKEFVIDPSADYIDWQEAMDKVKKDCDPQAVEKFKYTLDIEQRVDFSVLYIVHLGEQLGLEFGGPPGYQSPPGIMLVGRLIPGTGCKVGWFGDKDGSRGTMIYENSEGEYVELPVSNVPY
jgi:hypothetical protein